MMPSKIASPELASRGERSYEWAKMHMPTLMNALQEQKERANLDGVKVAACLHVTKETSVLMIALKTLGAEVHLSAANPLSTQDDIAAYLDSQGISVHAWRGETNEEYVDCIRNVLRAGPQVVMDDGGDTHITLHEEAEFKDLKPLGGTEETTTGVVRLKALEKADHLRYPIIAVNNAYTKYLFDNRYGTGQSSFDGILRATSLLIAGKVVVVCGYGWVGRGIALRAKGLGAVTMVTEVDPLRALEARMDGYTVMPMADAAKVGDLFITATGQTTIVSLKDMEAMKDGAILANAGHFDVEIDVKSLEESNQGKRQMRPHVEEYLLRNGKRIYLIAKGRIANLVAAEGHPPEVMSLSFTNQLLSAVHIVQNAEKLERKIEVVPETIDKQVAEYALHALGVSIDKPTEEQIKYAESWVV